MTNLDSSTYANHGAEPSGAEQLAAEKVINLIMAGMKNYTVFPPDHSTTVRILQGVRQAVDRFTEKFGDLCFEVGRQQILYNEKSVFSGEASDENPALVFYRDGIRWFSFLSGVDEEELASLFRIYNHYRVIPDEPEDDLVTALWRAELPHILHEASYELWDSEPRSDPGQFEPTFPEHLRGQETVPCDARGWEALRPDSNTDDYQQMSIAMTHGDHGLWDLTVEEQLALSDLIKEGQEYDSSEAAIRLMFLVLRGEEEPQIYESILNYLKEEFRSSLAGRNYRRAYFILDNVRKLEELQAVAEPWTVPLHNRFQAEVIREETLLPLISLWPILAGLPAVEVKTIVALLQLLPTKAGITLAAMIARVESRPARSLIGEIIASYATRDHQVLEVLLRGTDEDLVLRMLRVVRDLPERETMLRLLGQAVKHPLPKVGAEAERLITRSTPY